MADTLERWQKKMEATPSPPSDFVMSAPQQPVRKRYPGGLGHGGGDQDLDSNFEGMIASMLNTRN